MSDLMRLDSWVFDFRPTGDSGAAGRLSASAGPSTNAGSSANRPTHGTHKAGRTDDQGALT
jgi:hypothetical protein